MFKVARDFLLHMNYDLNNKIGIYNSIIFALIFVATWLIEGTPTSITPLKEAVEKHLSEFSRFALYRMSHFKSVFKYKLYYF